MVHLSSLGSRVSIYPAKEARLALLLTKEVTMPKEYSDFTDVFSEKLANVFLEQTGANEHAIELEVGKQLPYGLIYSLGPIEFKTSRSILQPTWQTVLSKH